jgi:hypothetical protein
MNASNSSVPSYCIIVKGFAGYFNDIKSINTYFCLFVVSYILEKSDIEKHIN